LRVPPILIRCRCARPWVIATRFSRRVSAHRTGLPTRVAAQATAIVSRSAPILAPNPPPTSGAITRIAARSRPSRLASLERVICAFCVLAHTVSRPPAQVAAAPRPSIGTGATRGFTIVASTTASQPSNSASPVSFASPSAATRLVPAAGNSRVRPASASSKSITASSGS
jgi:hypothetical protein